MKQSRKGSKRGMVESEWLQVPNSILLYHPATQTYFHPGLQTYTDANGQPLALDQWSVQETPRTPTSGGVDDTRAGPLSEGDHVGGENYILSASQGAATGYPSHVDIGALTSGVAGLIVQEPEEVTITHHQVDSQPAAGSSSHARSGERKSSKRRDEKTPSSTEPRAKDGTEKKAKGKKEEKEKQQDKGKEKQQDKGREKQQDKGKEKQQDKGKGKAKETSHQDGQPDGQPQHTHRHQRHHRDHDDHRAYGQKRSHGHKSAPTGDPSIGPGGESQPVDPVYGDNATGPVGSEHIPRGGHHAGVIHGDGLEVLEQTELPVEDDGAGMATSTGFGTGFPAQDDDENDAEMQRAMEESRQAALGRSIGFEVYPPGYQQGEPSHVQEAACGPIEDDRENGSVTPTQDNPGSIIHISGTPGKHEHIDDRYRVETSKKFLPGEVFKVLWPEPLGQGPDHFPRRLDAEMYTERMNVKNKWGEEFYVGFRRFLIIANDHGHCQCVPILTYMRQGCKKRGVKPSKHGVIHEFDTKPKMLEGEPKLGFKPIRMVLRAAGEKLAPESRVNYSKLVTVEHNVKVFFIGNIWYKDFNAVVPAAVDKCWQEKARSRAGQDPGPDTQ